LKSAGVLVGGYREMSEAEKTDRDDLVSLTGKELQDIVKNAVDLALRQQLHRRTETAESAKSEILSQRIPLDESSIPSLAIQTILKVGGALARRMRGDYPTDRFGTDPHYFEAVRTILDLVYHHYFRCEVEGIEHIPADGGALIVANHGGIFPWSGLMVIMAILNEHPSARKVRVLTMDWLNKIPFLGDFLQKTGHAVDCPENGAGFLRMGDLVCCFPEGVEAIRRDYSRRYRLRSFGRGEFVRLAIQADVPMIPCAILGPDDTYPLMWHFDWIGALLGLPVFPVTPQFPGFPTPFSLLPLPVKWKITFLAPRKLPENKSGFSTGPTFFDYHARAMQREIQEMLFLMLKSRRNPFL
jgi:1-acyl-sn-glycerol-3-phosphate acyltransferase